METTKNLSKTSTFGENIWVLEIGMDHQLVFFKKLNRMVLRRCFDGAIIDTFEDANDMTLGEFSELYDRLVAGNTVKPKKELLLV